MVSFIVQVKVKVVNVVNEGIAEAETVKERL